MPPSAQGPIRFAQIAIAVAVALPMLLAVNLPPSPTLLNQALAVALWGAALLAMAGFRERANDWRAPGLLQGALVLMALAMSAAWGHGALPIGIALAGVATVASAAAVALAAGTLTSRAGALVLPHPPAEVRPWASNQELFAPAFMWGLLIAGVVGACIGLVQVFAPAWADGDLLAKTSLPGRAVGNLRQPNHLSSALLWALIGLTGLAELRRVERLLVPMLGVLLALALVLTGSRTGLLGLGVLAAWALLDRRLSRGARVGLLALPLIYGASWFGVTMWAHGTGHAFGGEGRLSPGGNGDISSSRFGIWSDALELLRREPLAGIGFGEFNLAWTLTEFPHRPTAFFDHTHNLPLQLLVELGIPLGSLVMLLLLLALLQAGRRAWRCAGDEGIARRAAFMAVLMIGLHSLLEYPLWYAYFLLPTAFAWGIALARPDAGAGAGEAAAASAAPLQASRAMAFAGAVMGIGAAAAALDYGQVVAIYEPPDNAAPLEDRIARGQRSLLFGHHADYAAATAFGEPKAPLSPSQELAFRRAPHQLLDVRLMIAWSQALAAQGELDKARWLAARIREFRNPGADEYFEPCKHPDQAARAFQCQPPQREVHWREFVRR